MHESNTSSIRSDMDETNHRQMIITQARRAFSCSVLLGTTYVFGALALGELKLLFQAFFCIFNSLQGFFIFIFYIARNENVRKEWIRCFGIKDRASENQRPSGNVPFISKKSPGKMQLYST